MKPLDHCEQLTDRYCQQLLEQSWRQLDQRLDQQAQQISDQHRRTRHYLTMQEVHFKADQVAASVAKQNQQNFIRFRGLLPLRQACNPVEPGGEGQRDSLILNRAIQTVSREQHPALAQLNRRLALLRGGQRCQDQDNPLAAGAICHTFQDAVCELDVDPRTRLLLYEVFAERFETGAGEFYRSVNEHLVAAGILPNLLETVRPDPQPGPTPDPDPDPPIDADRERQLQQTLNLVGTEVEWPAAIRNALDLPGILPTETYVSACTLLQRQIVAHVDFRKNKLIDPAASQRQYFKYLIAHMNRQRAGLNRDLLLSVEMVTRLFQFLCQDSELPAQLRCLSSYLYAPCLKLALTDHGFLLTPQHPARQLLDLLLHRGTRWLCSQVEDSALFDTLQGLVSHLACDLSEQGTDFERALRELQASLALLDQEALQTEQREVQSQAGMESLDRARSLAQTQVRETLQQHQVLRQIGELVSGPCTDYLTFILLQHGAGKHWNQARHLMKGIALSVRGQLPREQMIQFQRGQQRLYKAVSKGLAETGYQGMLARDLLDSLRQAQQRLLENLALDGGAPDPDRDLPSDDGRDQLLDQLLIGQWYLFEDRPQNDPIALKLAWLSEGRGRALFVDARGERRRLEYADALRKSFHKEQLHVAGMPSPHHSEDVLETLAHQLRLNSLRQRFEARPEATGKSRRKIC